MQEQCMDHHCKKSHKLRAIIVVWDSKSFWLELIIGKSATTPYGQVARYYSCMGFEAFLARINNRKKCSDSVWPSRALL